MSRLNTVIDLLIDTKDKVSGLLNSPEDEHHRLKVLSSIDKSVSYLSLMNGADVEAPTKESTVLGPALTIGGKPIQLLDTKVQKQELQPKDHEIEDLRASVENAYITFPDNDTEILLETLDYKIILGVAKKAQMPKVTANTKVNAEFVDQLKEFIRKKAGK